MNLILDIFLENVLRSHYFANGHTYHSSWALYGRGQLKQNKITQSLLILNKFKSFTLVWGKNIILDRIIVEGP